MDVCEIPVADRSAAHPITTSFPQRSPPRQIPAPLGSRGRRVPKVDALRHYYLRLSQHLSLPFAVWYPEPTLVEEDGEYPCTVVELIDPANGLGDEIDGIFCRVCKGQRERYLPLLELELPPEDPNYQLVEDYWDWFWHWR